jgi:hypothetical protein
MKQLRLFAARGDLAGVVLTFLQSHRMTDLDAFCNQFAK